MADNLEQQSELFGGSEDASSVCDEERVRKLFQACDGDGDGYIDRYVKAYIAVLVVSVHVDISESDLLINMIFRNETSDEYSSHSSGLIQSFIVCILHLYCYDD
jgi:hypothetical protein